MGSPGFQQSLFSTPEFAASVEQILEHKFYVFEVADEYLGDLGLRYLTSALPFSLKPTASAEAVHDEASNTLATLCFTHLSWASQFLHVHGQGMMAGKDPRYVLGWCARGGGEGAAASASPTSIIDTAVCTALRPGKFRELDC